MAASPQLTQSHVSQMTPDEQEEWTYIARLRGNRLFKANLYDQAADVYLEAIDSARMMQDEDQAHELLCNLSTCLLKQGYFKHALRAANQILVENPNHIRALERRSKVYISLRQYDNAKADLIQATRLTDTEALKNLFRSQLEELKQIKKRGGRTYSQLDEDQDSDDEGWSLNSVFKIFSLPGKLLRAVENLCRKTEDI